MKTSPEIKVAETLDHGPCPYCRQAWFRVRIVAGGIMLMHEAPACADFRRLDAAVFYRVVKSEQVS